MSTYSIPVTCLNCAGRVIHQGTGVPTMGRTETAATAVCAACGTDHLLRVQLTATSGRSTKRGARLQRERTRQQ